MTTATAKQIDFIATLIQDREPVLSPEATIILGMGMATHTLGRSTASEVIGNLLRSPRAPRAPRPMVDVAEGWYRLADGDIAVVKFNRDGTRKYAMRLVEGTWEYERGLITKCAGARKLTLEEAAEYGKLYGRCLVCGRKLTNPASIEAGIGPICAGKF